MERIPPAAEALHPDERDGGDAAPQDRVERVGLFWSAEGAPGATEPFYGSGKFVAAAGLTQALAQYAGIPHVDVFMPQHEVGSGRQQFARMPANVCGSETAVAQLFPESDLSARFAAHRYDVLHDPAGVRFPELTYLRSRLAPHVFPVTGTQMGTSYSFDVATAFLPMLTAQIYPCDALICSTEASRQAMAKRLTDLAERYCQAWDRPVPPLPRLERIPWGVDTQRFAPRDQAIVRRDLDLPLDRRILLCVGHLKIQDKMDWTPLLLAFDRVRRQVPQRLLFVLAGACSSDYGEQVVGHAAQLGLREDVRTFFNLPTSALPSLYAACDVFVAPTDSPTESFGLTIVEAMACGRPVVASDWNGYKELILHGETGFRVRTDWQGRPFSRARHVFLPGVARRFNDHPTCGMLG